MDIQPPKRALKFLRWFCREDFIEEIEGDLIELFEVQAVANLQQASKSFWWHVVLHFRPDYIKSFSSQLTTQIMFKNYLTIAYRSLMKRMTYSLINILGLAFGMAICLLILQYVSFELSYDNFYPNKENIYRIQQDRYDKGALSTQWVSGAAYVGQFSKENFPEVEEFVRMRKMNAVLRYINPQGNPIRFKETNVITATPSILDVFSIDLLEGDKATALDEAHEVIISESIAQKYFGDESPIGKTFTLDERNDFNVTGVYQDFPENSHFKAKIIFSYETVVGWYGEGAITAWDWDGFYNYVQLAPNTDYKEVSKKITKAANETNAENWGSYGHSVVFNLQPLEDIHLYSNFIGEFETPGSGDTVYFLLLISFFVILIAWINYINLSTARSIDRAREVGIRKVMGSHRKHLVYQFLMETCLTNLLAIVVAFSIVTISLPFFSNLIGRTISASLFLETDFWLLTAAMFLIGTLLAGLYPSFVLSAFQPVKVLKGKMSNSKHGVLLRKGLVILQFTASIVLIICTGFVYKQVNFMQSQDLGFNLEQTLVLEVPRIYGDSTYAPRSEFFKNELSTSANISGITFSSDIPGRSPDWNAGGIRLVTQDETESQQYRVLAVDYDFIDLFDLEIVEGRKFSREYPNDSAAVLLNEEGIKTLGFQNYEEALNKELFFWGDTFQIVGVLKNYHQSSLKENYEPLIFRMTDGGHNYYSLKVNTGDLSSTIGTVEAKWREIFPEKPFKYFFLDDHFNQNYQSDVLFGKVFMLFASLALIIACLGLFGLASFTTLQRTKEIGIRKTLGASVSSILLLLSKDFAILLSISFLIGVPFAYYFMDEWLQSFANRTTLSWWVFVLSGGIMLAVAIGSVFSQAIQAAVTSPTKSLKE